MHATKIRLLPNADLFISLIKVLSRLILTLAPSLDTIRTTHWISFYDTCSKKIGDFGMWDRSCALIKEEESNQSNDWWITLAGCHVAKIPKPTAQRGGSNVWGISSEIDPPWTEQATGPLSPSQARVPYQGTTTKPTGASYTGASDHPATRAPACSEGATDTRAASEPRRTGFFGGGGGRGRRGDRSKRPNDLRSSFPVSKGTWAGDLTVATQKIPKGEFDSYVVMICQNKGVVWMKT
jgi:hypothetical protein